jgi:hypothetical protein
LKDRRALTQNEEAPRAATAAVASRASAREVGRHFVRAREVRHPEQIAQPPLGFRPGHVVGEIDAQASGQDVNAAAQVGQEPAGVAGQLLHENGTVAALERDLVVAEDDVHLRHDR